MPTRFATAAPVLCCAGADDDAELAAGPTVLLAALEALEDADDEEAWLDEWPEESDEAADERDSVVGRMIPEIVVAMLKASVGCSAGRSVCVGITNPVCAKYGASNGSNAGPLSTKCQPRSLHYQLIFLTTGLRAGNTEEAKREQAC